MPNLKPSEIADDVRQVLLKALRLKGSKPGFLSAFQILERLPATIRGRLLAEATLADEDSARTIVSQAAGMLSGVITDFLDTRGVTLVIGDNSVKPKYELCTLYRLESGLSIRS